MDKDSMTVVGLVVDVLIIPFGTILWFIIRRAIEDNARLEREFANYRTYVAEHYVRDSDFKTMTNALFEKLDKIENKIDRKADKP